MKLYTEIQVRNAIRHATFSENIRLESIVIDLLRPIELPSDEEIEEILYYRSNAYYQGFFDAIFMLRNKIKRDNK